MIKDDVIISDQYDVNAIASYFGLSQIKCTQKNRQRQKLLLREIQNVSIYYCQKNCLYYPFYFNNRIPLVVSSSTPNFELHLGLFLISFDPIKIDALLNFQKNNYEGESDFTNMVESLVYNIVQNNSPFDNSDRLERIMAWVKHDRLHETSSGTVKIKQNKEKQEDITTAAFALKHYYQQRSGKLDAFKGTKELTKREVMKKAGIGYGVGGDAFVLAHYRLSRKSNRISGSNIKNLKLAIRMLSGCEASLKIAEEELKEAELSN